MKELSATKSIPSISSPGVYLKLRDQVSAQKLARGVDRSPKFGSHFSPCRYLRHPRQSTVNRNVLASYAVISAEHDECLCTVL